MQWKNQLHQGWQQLLEKSKRQKQWPKIKKAISGNLGINHNSSVDNNRESGVQSTINYPQSTIYNQQLLFNYYVKNKQHDDFVIMFLKLKPKCTKIKNIMSTFWLLKIHLLSLFTICNHFTISYLNLKFEHPWATWIDEKTFSHSIDIFSSCVDALNTLAHSKLPGQVFVGWYRETKWNAWKAIANGRRLLTLIKHTMRTVTFWLTVLLRSVAKSSSHNFMHYKSCKYDNNIWRDQFSNTYSQKIRRKFHGIVT